MNRILKQGEGRDHDEEIRTFFSNTSSGVLSCSMSAVRLSVRLLIKQDDVGAIEVISYMLCLSSTVESLHMETLSGKRPGSTPR